MSRKITDIIITDALGCYGNVAKHIVESMGYRCWILDENDNRRGEIDFLNYESALNTPDNFAIWSLSDKATRIMTKDSRFKSKAIMTEIKNLEEYVDKGVYNRLFPKIEGINYPLFNRVTPLFKAILKPVKGSGTTLDNGRAKLVDIGEEWGFFEYIPHDKEQVVLAYFENGLLVDTCFYQGKVNEPWSVAKPNEVIVSPVQHDKIIEWLNKLGQQYKIDGIVDAEFMIDKEGEMWFSESNPRQNGQSYFIAKPMIYKFLERKISELEKE